MILASRSAQTVTKNPIVQQITITGFEGTFFRQDFLDALFIITMPNAGLHARRTRRRVRGLVVLHFVVSSSIS